MTTDNSDEKIRKLFTELRAADRRLTPPFARLWQRAMASRARSRRPVRVWLPAAAVAAVAIVTLIALFHLVPGRHQDTDNLSLAEWRSPTASLLRYPGQEYFRGTSELNLPLEPYNPSGWSRKL